jgi:hypothetical protein
MDETSKAREKSRETKGRKILLRITEAPSSPNSKYLMFSSRLLDENLRTWLERNIKLILVVDDSQQDGIKNGLECLSNLTGCQFQFREVMFLAVHDCSVAGEGNPVTQ